LSGQVFSFVDSAPFYCTNYGFRNIYKLFKPYETDFKYTSYSTLNTEVRLTDTTYLSAKRTSGVLCNVLINFRCLMNLNIDV